MSHMYYDRGYGSGGLWVNCALGSIPDYAPTVGGYDVSNEPLYIGRVIHCGDTIPGKVVQSHKKCYVAYNGKEYSHSLYQVLTYPKRSKLNWIFTGNGYIPENAIPAGEEKDGTLLYVGRAYHHGSLTIGKVHPNHKTLYIPFDGKEISISSYEILVERM